MLKSGYIQSELFTLNIQYFANQKRKLFSLLKKNQPFVEIKSIFYIQKEHFKIYRKHIFETTENESRQTLA